VDNPKQLTILSLCAGYGGLELGLSRALENPLRVIAVEIEAYALANLVANAEEGKLAIEALYPDLRTFPAERFRGCFDFVLAGYPCTPFSLAGRQTGKSHKQYIWPEIARNIDSIKPKFVFLENVPNHLNQGADTVLADLEEMGFVITCGLFEAAETGASIRSRRLFILAQAVRDGHGSPQAALRPRGQESLDAVPRSGPPGPSEVAGIPRMADDGTCRVDRCRLLGNGVVPQQAEKAFRELMGDSYGNKTTG
jgi:DNA (cytosine-5)-methyltransferase 1